uniref:G-protein coupled receptors family 1 profile domain-containing protein n=1 Tax=Oryctolagus cuniculus TaxID=9986 RepID=A0A5F9CI94_RABIT
MAGGNHSALTVFILAGLTEKPELQPPLFLLFVGIYVVTVVGNLGMITLIGLSSHLHTPMCYFLSKTNIISYPECMIELYVFLVFVISECHMLAAMSYDRCVAICNPLLYNVTMSYKLCSWLVVGVYAIGLVGATVHTVCMLKVVFCKADIINHYFCDLFPLLELSCSSTSINEVVVLCFSAFNILVPTVATLSSYTFIIVSILAIHSAKGLSKAFSTCSSHISAVGVFFGSTAFMYLQPPSVSSMEQGKVSSVFYAIIVPMLYPFIYSLWNKDVKLALKKILVRKPLHFLST